MVDIEALIKSSGVPYKLGVEAKSYSSYRGGGKLRCVAYPGSIAELAKIADIINNSQCGFFVMGAGTNCLIKDGGYNGLAISTARFVGLGYKDNIITCGGGLAMHKVLAFGSQHNLTSANALAGLPCSIGGAIYMNAGAFGTETKDVLAYADCYNLKQAKDYRIYASDIPYSYRSSGGILDNCVVYSAAIRLHQGDNLSCSYYIQQRLAKQPKEPSLGCVFANPPSLSAGYLIESVGLKGYRIGGAAISEKHANFIVNKGGGTAGDYIALIQLAKAMVYNEFKIELKQEIKILG